MIGAFWHRPDTCFCSASLSSAIMTSAGEHILQQQLWVSAEGVTGHECLVEYSHHAPTSHSSGKDLLLSALLLSISLDLIRSPDCEVHASKA